MLEVKAAMPRDFPPHYMVDSAGRPAGFAIEVMDRLAQMANLKVTYIIKDTWPEALQEALSGRADLIPNLGISPERKKRFIFTAPVETFPVRIFVRGDTYNIRGEATLPGHKVAVVRSNVAEPLLKKRPDLTVQVYEKDVLALFGLLSGEVDALVYPAPVLNAHARQIGVDHRIKAVGKPLIEVKRAIALSKSTVELYERLNRAVVRLVGSQEYQRIYLKWYAKPEPFWNTSRVLWVLGLLLLVSFLVLGGWRYWTVHKLNLRLSQSIEKLKLAEEELKAGERTYRLISENSTDLICLYDVSNGYKYVSPSAFNLIGYKPEELIGEDPCLFVHPDDAKRFKQLAYYQALDGQAAGQVEYRFRKKDGSYVWLETVTVPLLDEKGTVRQLQTASRDVTLRKLSEQALEDKEARYRSLFELSNDAVFLYDFEGKLVEVNSRACQLLGYSSQELLAKTILDCHPPGEIGHAREALEMVKNTGRVRTESALLANNGTIIPVDISASLIREDLQLIQGVVRDISKRRRAEQALLFTQFAVDRASEAAFWVGPEGRFVYVNDEACKSLGYSRSELLKMTVHDIDPGFPPEIWPQHWSALKTQGSKVVVSQHRRKDGTVFPVEISINYVEFGGRQYHCSFVRDITERKQAEKDKARLEEQLRQAQKMEAIGTLAGGIAHDFNNILAAIIGYSELASMELPQDHTLQTYLSNVLQAGNRAKNLVRQILSFSRPSETGQQPLRLSEILAEACDLMRSSIPTTISIRKNLAAQQDTIMADATQVHQLLMNLCTNAAQAMEADGGVLEVNLTRVLLDNGAAGISPDLVPGPYLKLEVHDNGEGMDSETMSHVFEPFFTLKEVGKGTGMGLAVAHGIVRGHGGAITVASQLGRGSTFTVYFPALDQAMDEAPDDETEQAPGGNEHILFVDDEESLVNIGLNALQRKGYQVTGTTSSLEALEMVRADPQEFDLIITDFTMPVLTGAQLAKRVLKIRPDLPVIIATGYSKQISPESAQEIGISRLVMKPLAPNEIWRMVREALDKD